MATIDDGSKPPNPRSIWLKLGFKRAVVPEPDCDYLFDGTTITLNTFNFLGWKDRLRVLVSGRLHVQTILQADVLVTIAHSRSALGVLAPDDDIHEK